MKTIDKILFVVGILAIAGLASAAESAATAPKPPETVLKSEYDAAVVEREHLRQQVSELQQAAGTLKSQRDALASNVLDAQAMIGALQAEVRRLTPAPTPAVSVPAK